MDLYILIVEFLMSDKTVMFMCGLHGTELSRLFESLERHRDMNFNLSSSIICYRFLYCLGLWNDIHFVIKMLNRVDSLLLLY